jgi:hypothetical protein
MASDVHWNRCGGTSSVSSSWIATLVVVIAALIAYGAVLELLYRMKARGWAEVLRLL